MLLWKYFLHFYLLHFYQYSLYNISLSKQSAVMCRIMFYIVGLPTLGMHTIAYAVNFQSKEPQNLEKNIIKQTNKQNACILLSVLLFYPPNFMYIFRPSATINMQSENWRKLGYHNMGRIFFLKRQHLASCSASKHCYLAKLESINQTATFP